MTEQGILDITAEEYFAIPALSNGGMKDLAVSPLRFWHRHINRDREPEEETAAQRIGSALHCAVLEGEDAFGARYVRAFDRSVLDGALDTVSDLRGWLEANGVKPRGTRKQDLVDQVKATRVLAGADVRIVDEEREAYDMLADGREVLTNAEWTQVEGMAESLQQEPVLMDYLSQGRPEVPMVAIDPATGVPLKAKLDWMAPTITLDLKTFTAKRGVNIDRAVHDAIWYECYYRQAYLYDYIRRIVTGEKSQFVFAFVESTPPHEVRIKALRSRGDYEANLYWERARVEVQALILSYAHNRDRYGDKPWRTSQTAETLLDEDIRQLAY